MVYRVDDKILDSNIEKIKTIISQNINSFDEIKAEVKQSILIDRVIVEQGLMSENEILKIYCNELHIELFEEEQLEIPVVFDGISMNYLLNFGMIPYKWNDNSMHILTSSPYELQKHKKEIKAFWGLDLEFSLIRYSLIERLINKIYSIKDIDIEHEADNEQKLRQLAGDAKIVRLVNEMFSQALEQNASDIHIEPLEQSFSIRFRIDGILNTYLHMSFNDYPAVVSRLKLIGNLNIAECRLPQDGRTEFQIGNKYIDIRVSTIPVVNGESIVLRLLRKNAINFDFTELGMTQELQDKFYKLINIPYGIVLVVGPTGSGKTTTLYSIMDKLNDLKRKIITIEDPVEYQMPGLSQMQINHKIGLSFASGLRHIVRQDPDVILVGEIRDKETAEIAINAALTGHLVFSTLHTNDAIGAITRLVDMGVERFLISSVLCGVLSQRLARKTCNNCKGAGQINNNRCRPCNGSGYKGRLGVYELLLADNELKNAIATGYNSDDLAAIAYKNGMVTLYEDGMRKVAKGITTKAEILRIASEN